MTDVGKIKFGVEVDADDLSAQLGEAVRAAVAPALAKIQQSLQKVQHEYAETGKAAEKSAVKQVASLKAVEQQADKTRIALERARAAAFNPGSGNGGSGGGGALGHLGNDNRSYDNRKVDNSRHTDNRRYDQRKYDYRQYDNRRYDTTYDYSTHNYNGGPPTPGPGNGPGNGNGGGRGRGGGIGGFLTSPVGLNAISVGAAALPALATGLTNIVGSVQQLVQAGLVLPGLFAAAGSSIGTAVIGFNGIADATKAMNDALKSGDPKDLKKFEEATKDMAPAGKELAKTFAELNRGPLLEFRKNIQGRMLDGFAADVRNLTDKALPHLDKGLGGIADSWKGTLKAVTGGLGSDRNLSLMDQIFGNTAEGQKRANAAIGPLISGFGTLAKEGSNFLPRLGDGLTAVSKRFDTWVQKNTQNGNMFRWIDEGLNGLRAFGNAILNVAQTITGLTKAAGQATNSLSGDGGFLGWLERATKRMNDFTNSAEGQGKIGSFFKSGREDMANIGQVLGDIWKILGHVITGFATWGRIIAPVVGAIANLVESLGHIPGLLEAIVVGFLAWRTLGPIITGLTTKLTAMGTAAAGAGVGPGAGGKKLQRGMAGAGLLAAGTITQQTSSQDSLGGQLLGALENIGGGALIGASVGGPVGAAVGAAAGAAIAGINFLLAENKTAQEAAAAAADKLAAANARAAEGVSEHRAAQKDLFDTLLNNGGAMDAGTNTAVSAQIEAIPKKLAGKLDEGQLKKASEDMAALGLTTSQMATIVTGSQAQFDALVNNLSKMGAEGSYVAGQLRDIRNGTQYLQTSAQTLAPVLQTLADNGFGSVSQAAAAVQNAFLGIPQNVPIDMSAPNAQAVVDILRGVGARIDTITGKPVILNADDAKVQEAMKRLDALGIKITTLPTGNIEVQLDPMKMAAIDGDMKAFFDRWNTLTVNTVVVPGQGPNLPPNTIAPNDLGGLLGAKATGGAIVGGRAGKDSVPSLLMPGEHVLTTADVSAMGGQAAVYAFRNALHFATGGEVPGGTNPLPMGTPDTEIGVLIQIRDLLAGKGGTAVNPLAATAANTATSAKAAATTGAAGGGAIGPFGTPLKPRGNLAYKAAAAAIQALGGDPTEFIGTDPDAVAAAGAVGLPGGVPAGSTVDVAALQKFALSGNTADLPPGLTINSPAVTAIMAARNKKKGGLDDQAISDLVGQALGPGGFSGTLDANNTSLVKALEKLRTKGVPGTVGGTSPVAGATGVNLTQLPTGAMDPVSAFAAQNSGGQYSWGASDLSKGLSDCSGAVSDLVEIITKGQADSGRLFSTANAAEVLKSLGAVEGAIPGALQIGWSDEHMRATLPNGVNFESGGGTGQGATYGGNAQGAAGMPNIMSLPANGVPLGAGMAGSSLGAGAGGQGTPVYVTNWPGQGGLPPGVGQILGAGFGAAGQAAGTVATDITGAIASTGQEPWRTRKPAADLNKLLDEGNPLALASAMGLNVQDFTRQGGAGGDTQSNDQKYDASGRLIGDTTSLMDRTFTDLQAQLSAMREQLVDVIEQTNQKLNDTALEPVIKAGMQSALESLKDSVSSAIGTALGQAAAPPIADAVKSAIPAQTAAPQASGNAQGMTIPLPGMADGGPISGGTPGVDSVPAMLMPGEFVLNTMDVARMGGTRGVELARRNGFRHFAKGGKVVNDVVGAEFFGVSEVPVLGAIINLIIGVLLKVIGIEIEARNTMTELTDEFRGFRGDAFKAFDATGRLLNDTSALMDRTSTSTEAAAEERIRILKIVIEAVIKYIIEKIIVPIGKAVANAAIQAGASAAGAAVNTQAPGAGGIVSSLISSGGQAGVEIVAEVGSDFAIALTGVLTDVIANSIQGAAPDLVNAVFGGGFLAALFDPVGGFLSALTGGLFGIISAIFGGLFGGASTLIPGIPFDNGGLARGKGVMLKDVNADELVLDPAQTDVFQRFVRALENGGFGGSNTTHVSAPITIVGGGRETADQVENRLLKLMP